MGNKIEILQGPALSGKTYRLLEIYRLALREGQEQQRPGRTLWIAPTHLVCEQVRRQLHTAQLPAILSPQVMTFEGFADRLLEYSGKIIRPVPSIMQRVLLRQIVDRLVAQGTIRHFAGIARTSGFLDVVLGLIAELKREEVWPADFETACRRRGMRQSDAELIAIYADYQAHLEANSRYDAEGRFWSARDQLKQHGNWGGFPEFDIVVVDGFADFTHTQYEILGYLAERSSRLLISLPGDAGDERADLFANSLAALRRLETVATCQLQRMSRSGTAAPETSPSLQTMAHLARELFRNPRQMLIAPDAHGIEVLAVTGSTGEVRAIAERVKALLLAGTPARDIVVAFRPLSDYAPLIRETFAAAGIPYHCSARITLSQEPLICALTAVLQLELNAWPFEKLAALLNSGWFRPKWKGWFAEFTPSRVSHGLRLAKVPGERVAILKAFERLSTQETEAAEASGNLEEAPRPYTSAWQFLLRFSEVLQTLRQTQNARGWANTILELGQELGLAPQSAQIDGQGAVDAWNTLRDLLFATAETEEFLGNSPSRDLETWTSEFWNLLQQQSVPAVPPRAGEVSVVDAEQVRGLDVPFLFLGGLSESSFPGRGGDSFLYTEADRKELIEQGLVLGHRTAQTQSEMLLFYSIVTRARKGLVLSYPAVSLSGQPLSASPYLHALRDLFEPSQLRQTRLEQLDPVPPLSSVLSFADLRVAATAEVLHRRPQLFQTLVEYCRPDPRGARTARSILSAVETSVHRFQTRGFTHYEGMLQSPANRRFLAERFSPDHEFSATQLESYAECPYRFWVEDVLKISELEAPDQFLDHGLRGTVVHDVLLDLHSQMEPPAAEIPTPAVVSLFRQLMVQRLAQVLPANALMDALLRIESRLLEEWGAEYALQWSDYHDQTREKLGTTMRPSQFEVSFGRPHAPQPGETYSPSLRMGSGDSETRIRGRIDRIDVGQVAGQTVFNIIDYKTGRKPAVSANHLRSGRSLQLVLYSLAVQRLDLLGESAFPMQAGYWCLKETGWLPISKAPKSGPDGLESHADWIALVDVLDELVPRLAAGIRAGAFPVYNTDDGCGAFCPYRTTCRVNQIRPLETALDKHWKP